MTVTKIILNGALARLQKMSVLVLFTNCPTDTSKYQIHNWPAPTPEAAIQRVNSYEYTELPGREKRRRTVYSVSLIFYQPTASIHSHARDIIAAETDDNLHTVFQNLVTALIKPSESKILHNTK
jgi:hypothetical protein